MKSKKVVATLVIAFMAVGLLSACGKRATRKVTPKIKLSAVEKLVKNSSVEDLSTSLKEKMVELDTAMTELSDAKTDAVKMDHDYEKLDDDSREATKTKVDGLSEKLLKIEAIRQEISNHMSAINKKEVKDRIVPAKTTAATTTN
jgi:hypothetical protein